MENFDDKIKQLDAIIAQNPTSGEAYYNKAHYLQEYFADDEYASDEERDHVFHLLFENSSKAIQYNPQLAGAYYLRAIANLAYEEKALAEADFLEALALDPEHVEANRNMAIVYFGSKEYEKGLACINKCVDAEPTNGYFYNLRAQGLGMLEQEEAMEADYQKAIELLGEENFIYYSRAIVHINNKRYDKAFKDLDRTLEIDPTYKDCYMTKAKLYEELGDNIAYHTTMIEMAECECFELDSNLCSALYSNRGVAYLDTEKDGCGELALSDFDKALEYAPDMTLALSNRASLYQVNGNLEEALADAQKAIEIERQEGVNMATPMLKKMIKELEEELGIKISLWGKIKRFFSEL